ncbi:MAG: YigZ family protein [Albidovulum sp.]
MRSIDTGINDHGSKYAVSGGAVTGRADIQALLRDLKRQKKFARATHSSWAAILTDDGQPIPIKGDDGEAGAGAVILRMLEREGLHDHVVIVTRWYGGVKLGGDRFRHVQEAVRIYLEAVGVGGRTGQHSD